MRANLNTLGKTPSWGKPVVPPFRPGHHFQCLGRYPPWLCSHLNHCFHLLGGELAGSRREQEKKREEKNREGKKRKDKTRGERSRKARRAREREKRDHPQRDHVNTWNGAYSEVSSSSTS
jgi:hypothetical protein